MIVESSKGRVFAGRLPHNGDLVGELTRICKDKGITAGRVEVIGAVKKARVGFYNQSEKKYGFRDFDQPMEILAVVGNISIKDGEPFVHAHITLSDSEDRAFGGHLCEGTTVFAAEFRIEEMAGAELVRKPDQTTGLPLWS